MPKSLPLLLAILLLAGCAAAPAVPAEESAPLPPVSASSAPPASLADPAPELPSSEPVPESTAEPAPEPVFRVLPLDDTLVNTMTGVSLLPEGPVGADALRLVEVTYLDFDGEPQLGRLIVHEALAEEVCDIFRELYEAAWPITRIEPIDAYGADDSASMQANNSSCFCARLIAGTSRYSVHSYGAAIDLNPVQNPYTLPGGVQPPAAAEYTDRTDVRPGMIVPGDACYNAFTSRGWTWGGHWPNPDYQHFEKPPA